MSRRKCRERRRRSRIEEEELRSRTERNVRKGEKEERIAEATF